MSSSDSLWPASKFYYRLQFGTPRQTASFQEISGFDAEVSAMDYRTGNNKVFSTIKMPKVAQSGTVTLKKGMVKNNADFWNWYNQISSNTIKREKMVIELVDESGAVAQSWTLINAFTSKIESAKLNTDDTEITIDTLELLYEGIQLATT